MKALRFLGLAALLLGAQASAREGQGPVLLLRVDGAIGPATTHYLTTGFERAAREHSPAVIIQMDTPGGLDAATRDINQAILASPVPVITWVAPSGARAASAGTYILYASHVAAMAPATNLGAATPVQIGEGFGGGSPEKPDQGDKQDEDGGGKAESQPSGGAMERKIVNDAAAYIRGLAELRGRNADWAEKAVREAVSLTADQALEMGVVDIVAGSVDELLQAADGRTVKMEHGERTLATAGSSIERVEPDWRSELLSVITNPTVAYLLMMIGIYGLVLEGYHPGAMVPGIVGAICLLLALFAFQVLPVNYAGLALIALGVILMVSEMFAPSFGALGIGGIISLIIGSIILMDSDVPGFSIDPWVIGGTALLSGLFFMGVMYLALRAWGRPVITGRQQMVGEHAEAVSDFSGGEGRVRVHGEIWLARSGHEVAAGERVTVCDIEGLTLIVAPSGGESGRPRNAELNQGGDES